ncbi:MAG TPA: hydroxyacid dehydrogenase [Candidatus Binatia bacterium]|jgi:D-lactate dehydrogenase|nr:hydroxyacid dehydrogenase [Candidatus Binatia bacterium]
MRIAFFEIEEWERKLLETSLAGHQLSFHEKPLTPATAKEAADAEAVSVFVYSHVNKETLDALPKVKFVTTRSMGFDHIDLAACKERGVAVARVPAYGDRTVAEHAFALILALSRKIFLAYERTEKGIFDYHGLQGFDLYRKTLGVVGGGKIGMNVARIAKGFEMDVLVSDPFPKQELADSIGFRYAPLDELLARADVVTLHAPYMPQTHHLMNAEKFAKMKRGAVLVNTARGALIDTQALLKALEDGILAGAGLDVLEEETFIKEECELMGKDFSKKCDLAAVVRNHMLIARNDVIITPHIGFNSREAMERIVATTVENVNGFAAGAPVNLVP